MCESCESGQPIYEAGCPGCEARALESFDRGRMERALKSESVLIPGGMSPEGVCEFIIKKAKERDDSND